MSELNLATEQQLRDAVRECLPRSRHALDELIRIPSVSANAPDQVARTAQRVAQMLEQAGLSGVQVLTANRADGSPGHPAVVGRRPAPPGAATVLLYAHYDVQPVGDESDWDTSPFDPVERDGRLYARGSADDKAGIAVHLTALDVLLHRWSADQGVGLVVFVEGEEEIGSPSFAGFLNEHRELLACDVIVVADSDNWSANQPSLTVGLRGLVDVDVEIATLDHALHSGMYGGAAPDALTALVTWLAGLWDDNGELAVADLVRGESEDLIDEASFRANAGVLEGVSLVGDGPLTSRVWSRCALSVIGIDAPGVDEASNTLYPSARARLSMRTAPGQDEDGAFQALRDHLLGSIPFGARAEVRLRESGRSFQADTDRPAYRAAEWALRTAWGCDHVVHQGVGASIPFIAEFKEVFPDADVLITGVEEPDARAHGPNESLHLGVFARAALAETLLLQVLAENP